LAADLFQAVSRAADRLATLNSRHNNAPLRDDFWLDCPVRELAANGIDYTIIDRDWQPISMAKLVEAAMRQLEPHLGRAVVHGDIHGRNILLLDRLPVFIDFAWSGPGHPLVDLVRLDAVVRSTALRMLSDERAMQELVQAIYIDGTAADDVLAAHPAIAASPLASLAVRSAAKIRRSALAVAEVHSLGLPDFLAMTSVVSAHILAIRNPGSGIERIILSVVGREFLTTKTG
jgi:aminoglycoside phosphotransferase (APT) family kinase protein